MNPQQLFNWAGGQPPSMWLLLLRVAVGFLLSAAIGWAGYRARSLSRSGVLGAIVVGTLVFGLGGWVWGLVLIAFFASSGLLSRYRQRTPLKEAAAEHFAKTGRRDLGQALANGSLAAALAVGHALSGGTQPLFFFAFVGAMAAVTADTWATELGVLSPQESRLITTGEPVERGTSGGISPLGALASAVGAWAIGFLALAFQLLQGWLARAPYTPLWCWLPLLAALGGIIGSLVDSLLGATVQATYYCLHCARETEQPIHRCGHQPIYLRGWHWLDNDWVNALSSLAGALVMTGIGWLVLHFS